MSIQLGSMDLIFKQVALTGSLIGNMKDTQEVIDFCAEQNIKPKIELVTGDKLDDVFKILESGNDMVIRYVLDMDKSLAK